LSAETNVAFDHNPTAKVSIFPAKTYTEWTLFDRIVLLLKREDETKASAQERVWQLLSSLDFQWDEDTDRWRDLVDSFLFEVIDYSDNVQEKRNALLTALAEQATLGNAEILPGEFFTHHGITAQRLSNWIDIVKRGRELLQKRLTFYGYAPDVDVRPLRRLPADTPVVILSGESGQGKSWQLYSLADWLSYTGVVALIDATTNAFEDTQTAEKIFWQDIAGHDNPLPLSRIATRIRNVTRVPAGRWLHLFIDKLHHPDEAEQLAMTDWEELGVRLIVAAPTIVATEMARICGKRATIIEVQDFTELEMRKFLVGANIRRWQLIPSDFRSTLSRPLLANLYKNEIATSEWIPTNEYTLFDRWWQRIYNTQPLSAIAVLDLSWLFLNGGAYPWNPAQLRQAGLDQNAVNDLVKGNALQRTPKVGYEVWHDRLLNWIVAEAIIEHCLLSAIPSVEAMLTWLATLFRQTLILRGRSLGYVAMDMIWILVNRHPDMSTLTDDLLDELATEHAQFRQEPFWKLLTTVGPRVTESLLRFIVRHPDWPTQRELLDALSGLMTEDLVWDIKPLVGHPSSRVVSASMRLVTRKPQAQLLPDLWMLYCDLHNRPERFADDANEDRAFWLQRDCYQALKATVSLDPAWLERAIHNAAPSTEPVHDLAYLLATLNGERERWLRCKTTLREKLSGQHLRSIIMNVYMHRDTDEIDWLRSHVADHGDLVGAHSLRALVRIAPDIALRSLKQLDGLDLASTRNWCMRSLILRRPPEALNVLQTRLKEPQELRNVENAFSGQADLLSADMVDHLLDRLEAVLDEADSVDDVYSLVNLLSGVNRIELLERLEKRQGSNLEQRLATLLADSPRPYLVQEIAGREPALSVLYKIGGSGLTRVANAWLASPHRFGKYDGIEAAIKRPDSATIAILGELACVPDEPNTGVAYLAAETLADLQQWIPMLRSILSLGMTRTPRHVLTSCYGAVCLLDPLMQEVFAAVEGEPSSGGLVALGIAGRSDYIAKLLAVLSSEQPGSDAFRSAVVALSVLDDPQGLASEQLGTLLSSNISAFAAKQGLLRNLNEKAIEYLIDHIRNNFDAELAIILLQQGASSELITPIIHASVLGSMHYFGDVLQQLWSSGLSYEKIKSVLNRDDLRQSIEQLAFLVEDGLNDVSDKPFAIYALGILDKELAIEAAITALENADNGNREYYPYLIVELDPIRAPNILAEHMCDENTSVVRAAIGRALASDTIDMNPIVEKWTTDNIPSHRIAICRILAYLEPTELRLGKLRTLLEDDHTAVLEAAEEAYWHSLNELWARNLIAAFVKEADRARQWRLLDAAIAIGDPGNAHQPLPPWLQNALKNSSGPWNRYVYNMIEVRRKKVAGNLEDTDRRLKR